MGVFGAEDGIEIESLQNEQYDYNKGDFMNSHPRSQV